MTQNKVVLECNLIPSSLSRARKKEIAAKLSLPKNEQKDLMFMSAILVSTGTNKNGATFLGSELIKARDSISQKPLDIEHEEEKIVGHICSSMYLDYNGKVLDDEKLYSSLKCTKDKDKASVSEELDKLEMDVGIVCVLYKDRFPNLAEEVELGKWKVSMECYYDDFDLKIGDTIVKKSDLGQDAEAFAYLDSTSPVRLVIGDKEEANDKISRVLRNVRFCGCGLVENPANPRSLVLEAANHTQKALLREKIEEVREAATLKIKNKDSICKSCLSEDNLEDEVAQIEEVGYLIIKNDREIVTFLTDYNKAQQEAVALTALAKRSEEGSVYSVAKLDSKFFDRTEVDLAEQDKTVIYSTDQEGKVKDITTIDSKEEGHIARRWGPEDNTAGICVNFRKYLYEAPGADRPGRIVATHWCKLFDKPCPVLGANAQDPMCLRNKFSRMTKEGLVHDNFTVPTSFAPETPVAETEEITLPKNPPLEDQIVDNPTEGTLMPESKVEDTTKISTLEEESTKPAVDNVINDTDIPEDPIKPKKEVDLTEYNPSKDFPVQIAKLTKQERASLSNEEFGLPSERKWPIHTKEAIQGIVSNFSDIEVGIKSFSKRRELFKNVILAALKQGVATRKLERKSGFSFKSGRDYDSDYGIPRLKLFPLDSREQVIAAMGRYHTVKGDVSDEEKERLFVNILRAATKFDINSERFRKRVLQENK